ncbi:MAG: TFIIB-type zinc finger domain-containing protein [Oscillospiraceae bacterium]|nr:TFIIB-type zinc finger domain-containing protein [Oscillospiraceae bacterium]
MKALVCEMCNSTDMVKQDGFFVCQHCGMKYSVEEAKKMMIEGTVDVTGTVKVDNSAFVEKYLINARRAKDKTDWEEVEKYYNMVEQNDPTNIEAIFYSAYGKAMLSLSDSDKFKRKQKFEVFEKSISVIDDNYDVSKSEELEKVIMGMSNDLITMAGSSFVYNQTTKNNITSDDRGETYVMFARAEIAFIESVENIIAKDEKAYLYKLLVVHYRRCIMNGYVTDAFKKRYQEKMQNAIDKLSQLDPSYQAPEIPKIKVKIGNSIALTIVYAAFIFAIFKWFMPIMRRADMEYLGWIFVAFGALGCLANVFSIIKKLKNK